MEINILHLYYDLLNLYGENGNIKALKKHLEEMGVRVNIEFSTGVSITKVLLKHLY